MVFNGALLIGLREGVEISLIVGILLSYLRRLGRPDGVRYVWLGTGLAIVIAIAFGAILYAMTGSEHEWEGQEYLEVTIMFAAVIILSYMTFWMKRHSRTMGRDLQQRIDTALAAGSLWTLVLLAFLSVIREGIETVMFLLGLVFENPHGIGGVISGTLLGVAIAVVIGWGVYKGTYRVNLRGFFQVMGTLLIVVAAGLLSNAIGVLIEAGYVPPVHYLWDLSGVLGDRTILGGLLNALVGYSDHPSIWQGLAWLAYLVVALVLYHRGGRRQSASPVGEAG